MYKVYYNNRLICIGTEIQAEAAKKIARKLTGSFNVRQEWEKFRDDSSCKSMWMDGDAKGLWNKFKSMFVKVEAAGGLVKNNKGDYLLIYRKGKWDLPKGKLEKKESFENAALREVEEECSVSGLKIVEPLIKTYHIYEDEGWFMLKHSHWFSMTTDTTKDPVPEKAEGIEKAIWAKPEQIKNYMEDMHPNIRNVLGEFVPEAK